MPRTSSPSPRTGPRRAGTPAAPVRRSLAPSQTVVPGNQGVKVSHAVTIRRSAGELYAFWRDFENLARVIKHPVTIVAESDVKSRRSVSAPPGDRRIEWDAVVINDEKDRLIAWRSLENADLPHAGTVRFEPAPGDEGTEVTVTLEYQPPGGKLAALFAKLSGKEPGRQVGDTLRRLKALMEAGEIPTTDGQPVGEPQRKQNR